MEEVLNKHGLSLKDVMDYLRLNREIYGHRNASPVRAMFVVLDFDNPDHIKLNELSLKVTKLNAWLVAHRHEAIAQHIINILY